jgi:hypothetical protein
MAQETKPDSWGTCPIDTLFGALVSPVKCHDEIPYEFNKNF